MATKTRIYKVTTPTQIRLIESPSVQRAIAFVARDEIRAVIPAQHEIFELARRGLEIERVTDEPVSGETRAALAKTSIPMERQEGAPSNVIPLPILTERYIDGLLEDVPASNQGVQF